LDTLEYNRARQGYVVSREKDGLHVLTMACKMKPDLIILDVMLPGMDVFEVISDGSAIPVLAFRLEDDVDAYTVFHISDELRRHGWQVPAYTMPDDATDVAVLRIVVREGFDMDLADALIADLAAVVKHLEEFPPAHSSSDTGFAH